MDERLEPVIPESVREALLGRVLAAAEEVVAEAGIDADLIARVNLVSEVVHDYMDWLEKALAAAEPVH